MFIIDIGTGAATLMGALMLCRVQVVAKAEAFISACRTIGRPCRTSTDGAAELRREERAAESRIDLFETRERIAQEGELNRSHEVQRLEQLRDDWLQSPDPEFHGRTAASIIENEQRRIPEGLLDRGSVQATPTLV